ncbi:MAG TPA: hypothetical protein VFV37_09060 [Luteibaculaceae bacterium]|nr:hypothetical protein [Luteibaculaceae bacterium]
MISRSSSRPTFKVQSEYTTLLPALKAQFGGSMNLSTIKLLSFLVAALYKVQTVNFDWLANGFNSDCDTGSSLRCIQRFFPYYIFDFDQVVLLIFRFIPKDGKIGLTLDRTNWKFGQTNINILVLGVLYQGISFPRRFKMMDKFGNRNTHRRIDLMERYGNLFGFDTIDFLVADRKFVGRKWLEHLTHNHINYHTRIREN